MDKSATALPPWYGVAAVAGLAAALRLYDIGHAALSHFDEGVYAYSAQWVLGQGHLYPAQAFYAPMLYPTLVGTGYLIAGGSSAAAAVAVSALAGVATCGIVCWLGWRLFGPIVGIVAAALLAVDDFHIALSKTALTDATFTCLFTAALGLLHAAWTTGKVRDAVAAGLVVGLAWNTKYNGFLPLAIALVAILAHWLMGRREADDRPLGQALGVWLVSAIVAAACYLPWAAWVDAHEGYGKLVAHQAGYLSQWRQWPQHVLAILGNFAVFRHVGTACSLVGLVSAGIVVAARRPRPTGLLLAWTVVALAGAVYAGTAAVYVAAAACGLSYAASRGDRETVFVAAWVLVLFLLTPLYRPYARLALPVVPGMILLAVAWFTAAVREVRESARFAPRAELAAGVVFMLLVASAGGQLLDVPFARWQAGFAARGGYVETSRVLDRHTERNARVIYHAQPPAIYYTPRAPILTGDQDLKAVVDDVAGGTDAPVYLVHDLILEQNKTAAASLKRVERLEEVATIDNDLSVSTLLDVLGPNGYWSYLRDRGAERYRTLRTIRVYRVRR